MKKFWIGGYGACAVHNEYSNIANLIRSMDYGIIDDYKDADVIICLNSCVATYKNLRNTINCMEQLLQGCKEDATMILSGCLAKGVNIELTKRQLEIINRFTLVKPEELILYVSKMVYDHVDEKEYRFIPFTQRPYAIQISPVSGCLNRCSFCKSQYMNFDLRSYPFERVEELRRDLLDENITIYMLAFHSSNLSLYGVDLYNRPRAHEVIRTLSSLDQVKFVYAGALINLYRELIDEILTNPKIKNIHISLESGSPRIYKLMNRPIPLERLVEIIKLIKRERPDIVIHTELIAGFPTENKDDLMRSSELIHELDIVPEYVHAYQNSPHTATSLLPQSSMEHRIEARNILIEELKELKEKFRSLTLTGEHVALKRTYPNGIAPKSENYLYTIDTLGNIHLLESDENIAQYREGDVIPAGTIKLNQFVYLPKNKQK